MSYKPDYFKLVPKENVNLQIEIIDIEQSKHDFGYFSNHIFHHENEWALVRFDPYLKAADRSFKYTSRDEAIDAAKKFLDRKGFKTIDLDLEWIIGKEKN